MVDLLLFPRILESGRVGDQTGMGVEYVAHNAKPMRADCAARLGDFYYCVHQSFNDFGFGSAPGEFNCALNAPFAQVAAREVNQFRGNSLTLKIFQRLNGGVLRHHEYPAAGLVRTFRIHKIADFLNCDIRFQNPIEAG